MVSRMSNDREKIRKMMMLVNRIDDAYFKAIRSAGIKDSLFVLLYAIYDGEQYSQKEICEEWGIPKTTLNTIVKECVRDGYVFLMPTGSKEKKVVLTDKGRQFAEEVLLPVFKGESRAAHLLQKTNLLERMEEFTTALEEDFKRLEEKRKNGYRNDKTKGYIT